jgi:hypothetical protein
LEYNYHWVQGGLDLSERLRATAPVVEQRKAAYDPATIDWSDPRWK